MELPRLMAPEVLFRQIGDDPAAFLRTLAPEYHDMIKLPLFAFLFDPTIPRPEPPPISAESLERYYGIRSDHPSESPEPPVIAPPILWIVPPPEPLLRDWQGPTHELAAGSWELERLRDQVRDEWSGVSRPGGGRVLLGEIVEEIRLVGSGEGLGINREVTVPDVLRDVNLRGEREVSRSQCGPVLPKLEPEVLERLRGQGEGVWRLERRLRVEHDEKSLWLTLEMTVPEVLDGARIGERLWCGGRCVGRVLASDLDRDERDWWAYVLTRPRV